MMVDKSQPCRIMLCTKYNFSRREWIEIYKNKNKRRRRENWYTLRCRCCSHLARFYLFCMVFVSQFWPSRERDRCFSSFLHMRSEEEEEGEKKSPTWIAREEKKRLDDDDDDARREHDKNMLVVWRFTSKKEKEKKHTHTHTIDKGHHIWLVRRQFRRTCWSNTDSEDD